MSRNVGRIVQRSAAKCSVKMRLIKTIDLIAKWKQAIADNIQSAKRLREEGQWELSTERLRENQLIEQFVKDLLGL